MGSNENIQKQMYFAVRGSIFGTQAKRWKWRTNKVVHQSSCTVYKVGYANLRGGGSSWNIPRNSHGSPVRKIGKFIKVFTTIRRERERDANLRIMLYNVCLLQGCHLNKITLFSTLWTKTIKIKEISCFSLFTTRRIKRERDANLRTMLYNAFLIQGCHIEK